MSCHESHWSAAPTSSESTPSQPSESASSSQSSSTSPSSASEPSNEHYDKKIAPFLQPYAFWFPMAQPTPAFSRAFREVIAKELPDKATENDTHHPIFEEALKTAFPACETHEDFLPGSLPFDGCAACSHPQHRRLAKCRLPEFFGGAPDFAFRAAGCDLEEWVGVVDIKCKGGRRSTFSTRDVAQVVRHGRHILARQPLRDHATVCLFTFGLLQFFQVFRSTRVIRRTEPLTLTSSFSTEEALAQLYSYFTATAAAHGIRKIQVPGLIIEPNPQRQRLGSGSFSTVVQGRLNKDINVAIKLYQRFDLRGGVFDRTRFDREVALLGVIAGSPAARPYAPTIHESDKMLQFIVLSPVGWPLSGSEMNAGTAGQLVEAMRALHTVCIHRDLHAANILLQPEGTVMIIDWNLGLTKEQLSMPQVPAGALCVQGFDVLACMGMEEPRPHRYTHREDLQSLVRALHLLVYNVHVSPTTTAWEWADFWSWRLTGPVPPTHVFSGWVAAEAAAVAGDYDELKECFELMLAK
eukprot:m.167390 g.167390  ORF g.167390 m.167390 type:complete len:524 (-) comp15245_c0_seq34:92-1663(-)